MSIDLIVNENGITTPTYAEILKAYQDLYKSIYGDDIDVTSSSPDGQQLGIWASAALDLSNFGMFLSTQIDPDAAKTRFLDRISKLAAVQRIMGTSSTVDAVIVCSEDVTIKQPFQVADINGTIWETRIDYQCVIGDNKIVLYSEDEGDFTAGINVGDISEPQTVYRQVDSVANTDLPVAGLPEENDEQMRERRNRSLETPAFSVTASLLGKVLQIEAVKDANIFENYTSAFDSDKQLNPHTIWLIVDAPKGSNDFENELAYLLAYNKTAGTGMKGQKSYPLTFEVPNPKGGTVEVPMTVSWDYPTPKEMFITVNVKNLLSPLDPDYGPLQNALAKKQHTIGEVVYANEYYETALAIETDAWVIQTITIGTTADNATQLEIKPFYDEIMQATPERVLIVEV